jgi:hypothetical protein
MFNRLCLLTIAFSLLTTQSFAASQSGLKAAFDEFAYSMEVEGAALDAEAKQEAISTLVNSISDMQEQGLSNQQLIDFAGSQIKDKAFARDIKEAYAQMQAEQMSAEQGRDLIKSMATDFYSKGANWSGDVQTIGIIGLVLVLVAVAVVLGKPGPCANEAYARGNIGECQNSGYNGAYYNI